MELGIYLNLKKKKSVCTKFQSLMQISLLLRWKQRPLIQKDQRASALTLLFSPSPRKRLLLFCFLFLVSFSLLALISFLFLPFLPRAPFLFPLSLSLFGQKQLKQFNFSSSSPSPSPSFFFFYTVNDCGVDPIYLSFS